MKNMSQKSDGPSRFWTGHPAGTEQCLQCCRRGPWPLQLLSHCHFMSFWDSLTEPDIDQRALPCLAEEAKRKAMTMADATAGPCDRCPAGFQSLPSPVTEAPKWSARVLWIWQFSLSRFRRFSSQRPQWLRPVAVLFVNYSETQAKFVRKCLSCRSQS